MNNTLDASGSMGIVGSMKVLKSSCCPPIQVFGWMESIPERCMSWHGHKLHCRRSDNKPTLATAPSWTGWTTSFTWKNPVNWWDRIYGARRKSTQYDRHLLTKGNPVVSKSMTTRRGSTAVTMVLEYINLNQRTFDWLYGSSMFYWLTKPFSGR